MSSTPLAGRDTNAQPAPAPDKAIPAPPSPFPPRRRPSPLLATSETAALPNRDRPCLPHNRPSAQKLEEESLEPIAKEKGAEHIEPSDDIATLVQTETTNEGALISQPAGFVGDLLVKFQEGDDLDLETASHRIKGLRNLVLASAEGQNREQASPRPHAHPLALHAVRTLSTARACVPLRRSGRRQ